MIRVGIGYDVHRFISDRPLILGGIHIPSPVGLEGHSDADVLSHSIADALLGAAGMRDIGHHFPNTDPQIAGISSLEILAKVRKLLIADAVEICNIDATLIGEEPKIAPHLVEMRTCIGNALDLPISCIGIKATTNEGLGFIGRKEGLAAMAVACIQRRNEPNKACGV